MKAFGGLVLLVMEMLSEYLAQSLQEWSRILSGFNCKDSSRPFRAVLALTSV
jgi:hypothetical protein